MLKELREKQKRLMGELNDLNRQVRTEELKVMKKLYGVYVGCTVKAEDGKLHRVVTINCNSFGKPWLMVNPQKKDGEFGKAVRHVFGDWEVVND